MIDVIDSIVMSLPAGTMVKIAGISVMLESPARITTSEGNWKMILEWESMREPKGQAERIKSAKRVM